MHLALARAYLNKLEALFLELEDCSTPAERLPLVVRMQNLTTPLFVVNSAAAQLIEESLRKLKYPDHAVVNAALATIRNSIELLDTTIMRHGSNNFLLRGTERTFAKPVAELELRSLASRGRLFDQEHNPFVAAIGIEPHIEHTFLKASPSDLKPVLQRMGFPHTEALIFFKTDVVPTLGKPADNIPSLNVYTFRSGSPLKVLKHRVL